MNKSYSEMLKFDYFEDRLKYLKLDGRVAEDTFGGKRILNQEFYKSYEWKRIRDKVISRDNGCDLGVPGYEIYDKVLVHHINPITDADIVEGSEKLFDLENLVCVSHKTHNFIHTGLYDPYLENLPKERRPGDTKLW